MLHLLLLAVESSTSNPNAHPSSIGGTIAALIGGVAGGGGLLKLIEMFKNYLEKRQELKNSEVSIDEKKANVAKIKSETKTIDTNNEISLAKAAMDIVQAQAAANKDVIAGLQAALDASKAALQQTENALNQAKIDITMMDTYIKYVEERINKPDTSYIMTFNEFKTTKL